MITAAPIALSATGTFDFERASRPGPQLARNIGARTTEEAATALGVTVFTIRRWVASGRLGSIKVGNQRFIPHRALLDYFWTALENPDTRGVAQARMQRYAGVPGIVFRHPDDARVRGGRHEVAPARAAARGDPPGRRRAGTPARPLPVRGNVPRGPGLRSRRWRQDAFSGLEVRLR